MLPVGVTNACTFFGNIVYASIRLELADNVRKYFNSATVFRTICEPPPCECEAVPQRMEDAERGELFASRCRAVVYDSVQHICHFFLDDGNDVAVPAAKMIYLRVVSKECLVGSVSSSEVNYVQPPEMRDVLGSASITTVKPAHFAIPATPKVIDEPGTEGITTTEQITQSATFATTTTTASPVTTPHEEAEQEAVLGNEVLRDINSAEASDRRWQSSMEQLTKNTDYLAFKGARVTPPRVEVFPSVKTTLPPSLIRKEKVDLNKALHQKMEQLKQNYPNRYTQYLAEKAVSSFPISAEETATVAVPSTPARPKSQRAKFFAKRINFDDDHIFTRREGTKGDIRRQPEKQLKQVTLDGSSSFMNKARSFLENVNSRSSYQIVSDGADFQVDSSASVSAPTKGCSNDHLPIWLNFDNSVGSEMIDSTYVDDLRACRDSCADETCTSFTFFGDKQCMVNVEDGGVHLRSPPRGQKARTDLKFCYPDNINPYQGCSTFVGSRDHALTVEPREVFDGLPPGYEGLKLCIELCVLSTQYACRSATFLVLEGTCSLSDADSARTPSRFQRSDVVGQLYFENGCGAHPRHAQFGTSSASIERIVVKPKSPPAKALQIKPIKLKRRSQRQRRFRAAKL
ncbi:PAN domain protein [Ancylostoma ceylanicum]|uniref:PAN domain protein n=1 Tax=Ancylostoma ceylanicum TaxID=53326 RepID=A0A0D6M4L0_9BILA|nr:PAN domain protein [Ancylostoma ceylanicum]